MRAELPSPVRLVASVFSLIAGVFLLALVILTVTDVLSRNVRNQSILGTIDISTMLLVAIAFLGLGAAELNGKHVAVGLVEERLPIGARVLSSLLRLVLLAGLAVLLIWGLADSWLNAVDRGDRTNDILRLPTAPWRLILLLSFTVFFVLAIWKEVMVFLQLRKGREPKQVHTISKPLETDSEAEEAPRG
jgi:TRAP-type C4-dicarboxylate transport system permease small subunit